MSDDSRDRTITSPSYDPDEIEEPDDDDGGGSITRAAVLSALGITGSVWNTVATFARNPVKAISGVAFSAIVSSALGILEPIIDAFSLVIFGTDTDSPAGTLGIIDVPVLVGNVLITGGEAVGGVFTGVIESLILLTGGIVPGGILAFPIGVGATILLLIVVQRAITVLGPAIVSAIPVVGSPLARILEWLRGD